MGAGTWTKAAFTAYTTSSVGMDADTYAKSNLGAQEIFKARSIHQDLVPYNVMRECVDTEEHPKTFPVILALDVTGSMGSAAAKVAKTLGEIMDGLYSSKDIPDIEFCVMAIGDLYCDASPIQISQFESDTRIAEHLDKVYFERGGGGNLWESYTAAWFMGARNCSLDCWKRGQKGVIITLGDEQINPYLQANRLNKLVGCGVQDDVKTEDLYKEASEKYSIYHISVNDRNSSYGYNNRNGDVDSSWKTVLSENYVVSTIDELPSKIVEIVKSCYSGDSCVTTASSDGISW